MRCAILLLVLVGLLLTRSAQAQQAPVYLELGAGANAYRGDLGERYRSWKGLVHAGLQFNGPKRVNASVNLAIGSLVGQALNYQVAGDPTATPNTFFESGYFSIHLAVQYNILRKEQYLLYLSQGLGLFRFDSKDELDQPLLDQIATRPETELYNTTSLILPTALGFTWFLPNRMALDGKLQLLNTQTDFIDNLGLWGNRAGNDQVMQTTVSLLIPLK